jgi:hypothetical protein
MPRSRFLLAVCAALALAGCFRPKPSYSGFFEVARCDQFEGWALDFNRLTVPLVVSFYDEDNPNTPIKRTTARLSRVDLMAATKEHGFLVSPIPSFLFDGKFHNIHARFADTSLELRNSPIKIFCPAQ